ncbi:hypothetical protein D9619_012376 [Psilocybe cf. subviscida]|uniref:Uncharacterized protein n=1 Tax=Psilocybe cf. subviscida TaxID=2480587 RepID=A0A8H5ARK6_9AGAR|nr:hypothetical protein D9619_012376 [Psilocybe cf. subviscida]
MHATTNSLFPPNLVFPDASTIYIECTPQEIVGLALPDIQLGVMRLVVGTDFAQRPAYLGQHFDANLMVVSLLDMVLALYVRGRDDVHSLIIYVDAITSLHWQGWLQLVDPACLPDSIISLAITASPSYSLADIMQETHSYELDERKISTKVLYEVKASVDGLFLLAGNPIAGVMNSLKVTRPVDPRFFKDYYHDHIHNLQSFLSAASNLKKLEVPLYLRHSLTPLLQFCQDLRSLSSIEILSSNDFSYDHSDSFAPAETDLLKETFASTITRLPNLEALTFPAFLMTKQLLLALSSLPKLDKLAVSASPGLEAESAIVQASLVFRRPLPKMQTLNLLIIEVGSESEVRVPLHQRTKAVAPNATIQRSVIGLKETAHNPDLTLQLQQATGPSFINFRLS